MPALNAEQRNTIQSVNENESENDCPIENSIAQVEQNGARERGLQNFLKEARLVQKQLEKEKQINEFGREKHRKKMLFTLN